MTHPIALPITCPILVGRDRHLAGLQERLDAAIARQGQTVLIGGEAGAGKTRLAGAAAAYARAHGMRVLTGQCFGSDRALPYAPWRDLARSHLREHAWAAVRQAHPAAAMTLWAEDEHRLDLLPVPRRVWAAKGQRPVAHVRRKYEWLSVYGFVRPATGQSWWALLPTVNTAAMALALATFARAGIDTARRAVLVVDQAGWHIAHNLTVPDGIDLVLLPAQSPELQPAERLWTMVDEPSANRAFPSLDALETVLVERCRTLEADPPRLKGHTHFHWWPPEPPPAMRL